MYSPKFLKAAFCTAVICFCAGPAFASLMATATYTTSQTSPGVYNYNLTLTNTGTTNIGTFWFSWVPGAGFLSPVPTSVQTPANWTFTATNSGAGIRWATTTSLLASGSSLSGFSFTTTETPSQLTTPIIVGAFTDPATVFYVYEGAPLVGTPYQSLATAATPEPGSLLLVFSGLSGGAALLKRRKLATAQAS